MKVYPNSDTQSLIQTGHPVFKFVEAQFDYWLNNSNPVNEYEDMYNSDDAIYDRKGAIQDAIREACNQANEDKIPIDLNTFDLDAFFE